MKGLEFDCAGQLLEALPMGALYWPAERLLAVADLHLEKGSSYAVNARKLLPRYDTRQTLGALATLIEAVQPRTVVCLGDSFHDKAAIERIPDPERLEIEQPSLVRLLHRLEKSGMIERRVDGHDRRIKRVYLAAGSAATMETMEATRDVLREEFLRGLNAKERDQVVALLARIKANLLAIQEEGR